MGRKAARDGAVGAMPLADILFRMGFGTRRECQARVRAGQVRVLAAPLAAGAGATAGPPLTDPECLLPTEALWLEVDGQPWPWRPRALLMLNKPAGCECSRQPREHPSVLSLLPAPLQRRGVQPVGRLDADTTGLLLLTDDGPLLHRLTSPRHHVDKVYLATLRHPLPAAAQAQLLAGVLLHDDPTPARARALRALGERVAEITLDEGRYHQVKRMFAAVGNRVEALHRSRFGAWTLPDDLPPGAWRWLDLP
jgi:16S rRNA pseudouridine516 synthase